MYTIEIGRTEEQKKAKQKKNKKATKETTLHDTIYTIKRHFIWLEAVEECECAASGKKYWTVVGNFFQLFL